MPKDPKKVKRILIIIGIIVGATAAATGVIALGMKEYIIAAAMFIVTGWQVVNIITWRKCL